MNDDSSSDARDPSIPHPWTPLENMHEAEAWIDLHNRELAKLIGNRVSRGHGICFHLEAGGDIYMHTNPDGDILLDVTPEAQWATPVIEAATRAPDPGARLWMLPGDVLIQLVLGLNSLIGSTSLVTDHPFRARKF